MATYLKTYKTRDNESVIKLRYAGVDVTCHFKNGNVRFGKWATLTTSNEIVQRAIESSVMYGKMILPDGEPILIQEKKKTEPEDIVSYAQLRDYLVSDYGCDRTKIASPKALKAKVTELGIDVPNMVWN